MRFKIFSLSFSASWLTIATAVFATLILVGAGISQLSIMKQVDYGQTKIGEPKSLMIAKINQTISPGHLNFSTACTGSSLITASVQYFSGGVLRSDPLNLNGLTVFGVTIDAQPMNITVSSLAQGRWNCTTEPVASNFTNITFVDAL